MQPSTLKCQLHKGPKPEVGFCKSVAGEVDRASSRGAAAFRCVSSFLKRRLAEECGPPWEAAAWPQAGAQNFRPVKWTQQTSKASRGPQTGHGHLFRTRDSVSAPDWHEILLKS